MKRKRKIKIKNMDRFIRVTIMSLALLILVITVSFSLITHISAAINIQKEASQATESLAAGPETAAPAVVPEEPKPESAAVIASDPLEATKSRLRTGHTDGLKVVFLTFDDGPKEHTGEILDILKTYNVPATFFTVHREGPENLSFYQRMVAEGHTLANHTSSHDYDLYSNPTAFFADVEAQDAYIKQVTGLTETSHMFRFPGGSLNANKECVKGIVTRGYTYADWNVVAGDGTGSPAPEVVVANIVEGCRGQEVSIVLCHAELKANTQAALPAVIETLKAEGYTFLAMEKDFIYPQHLEV